MILQMGSLDIPNVVSFDYLDGPSPESLSWALESLVQMKCLNLENGQITEKGKLLSQFPLPPKFSNTLVKSFKIGCSEEVLNIISLISSGVWRLKMDKN